MQLIHPMHEVAAPLGGRRPKASLSARGQLVNVKRQLYVQIRGLLRPFKSYS